MAKEQKKKQNSVHITGYLKENNLERVQIKDKGEVIRGSIIIATDETSSYKVQYYVSAKTKDGEDSKDFEALSELLPDKVVSIASYLKGNPGSTFEMAAENATKVWALARFEEFASSVGERSKSMILIKGFKAGIKQETEESPFNPHAEFTVDIFVKDIKKEVTYEDENDEDGTETGRLIITGLVPVYDESVYVLDLIAPVENGIADFVGETYAKGDTGTFKGNLVNIDKKVLREGSEDDDEFFGVPSGPQYRTIFIRERVITGLSKKPLHQGDADCITIEAAKAGMAKRAAKMEENGKREQNKAKKEETPKAETKKDFADDMDF